MRSFWQHRAARERTEDACAFVRVLGRVMEREGIIGFESFA